MRKSLSIFLTLILLAFLAFFTLGCGQKKVEETYGLDFSSPEYTRAPIKGFSKNVRTWTPTSKRVAECLDANDLQGALEILYWDIVETDPYKEDQFFFCATGGPTWSGFLFMDPKLVFDLYRDSNRSGWTLDEKAAAELMVTLAYGYGGYSGAVYEEPGTEGNNTDKVTYELRCLALDEYERIAEQYPDSKVAVLAMLARAVASIGTDDALDVIANIENEIESKYPDSIYVTKAQLTLASAYRVSAGKKATEPDAQEQLYSRASLEYKEVLEMPDYLYSCKEDLGSAHSIANQAIEEIEKRLEVLSK